MHTHTHVSIIKDSWLQHTHILIRRSNLIFRTHFWTESLRGGVYLIHMKHSQWGSCVSYVHSFLYHSCFIHALKVLHSMLVCVCVCVVFRLEGVQLHHCLKTTKPVRFNLLIVKRPIHIFCQDIPEHANTVYSQQI